MSDEPGAAAEEERRRSARYPVWTDLPTIHVKELFVSPTIDDATATAQHILEHARVFAVVGASPSPWRPSHGVMQVLLDHGYEVVPITPRAESILGRTTYPDLASVPDEVNIDVVDIFRRSDRAGVHVDEAIERGAGAVWLQLGVIDHAAAARARAAGLNVVMDRCPAIELARRPRG